jgi:hypothetical protein
MGIYPPPEEDYYPFRGNKIPLPEVKEEVYVYTIILSSRYE